MFESWWFNYEILKKNPSSSYEKINKSSSCSEPKYSSLRSILVRSHSHDNIGNSFNYASFSPNSVLFKSVPSRKLDFATKKQEQVQVKVQNEEVEKTERRKKKIRRQGTSKSLSELEFEEVKGFMDLGFVFSEKDQDPSLVEIIPGLQRLSKHVTSVRRPYLSEAWEEDLHNKKLNKTIMDPKTTLMINWEVPCVKDENQLKDNLKLWAHNVASIVR
ncbi:DUF1685 family protein [Tanacetum coccineum]